MTTLSEITTAINEIPTKKQTLYNQFLHLQSLTPSSFTLPFNWAHIDEHFTSLHTSLISKFNLLQSVHLPTRPELISFCQNSDGSGLVRFIGSCSCSGSDQELLLDELVVAYGYAKDIGSMVLDAVVDCECEGSELTQLLVMLEGLIRVKDEAKRVSVEVKEKAMEVAVEWKRKRGEWERVLGFLLLVGAYGLVERFGVEDVIECFVVVARDRRAVDLCRRIVPENSISDVIQKLIDKNMHVPAVNFSIGLQKTKEFPPVRLLEHQKLRSMMVIEEARRNVKDLHVCNEVIMNEIDTLKSIIKCIEENHLQSDYPKDSVVELVNKLENEVKNSKQALVNDLCLRKQPTRAAVLKSQLRSRKQPARAAVSKNQPQLREQPAKAAAFKKNQLQLREQPARAAAFKKNQLRLRKQPARAVASKNPLRVREQPARATVLKNQLVSKSKKRELNKGQAAADTAAPATPIQNVKFMQEFRPQKSDLSPDHVGECHSSPLGLGPTGPNSPRASPVVSHDGPARAVIGNKSTGSNAPCASPVVSHDGLTRAGIGNNSTSSNAPCASPVASNNGSTRAVTGNDLSGLNAPCESPVASHDGSTRAVTGNDPTSSNAPYASPVASHDGSTKAVAGNEPTGSNAPYASPVASHGGSTRAYIGYDFYAHQILPPSDNHSNGWISD